MPIYKFSPEYMTKDERKKLSVGREDILSELFKRIDESSSKRIPRHYLIIGQRGIGKTHLLLLLKDKIEESKLKETLIPIKFSEEEYSISRLSDLFLRILDLLGKDTTKIRNKNEEEIVEDALHVIKKISEKERKIILLLLENLQLIFNQLDDKELGRLRETLQKEDIFLIIGTAPQLIGGITDYEEPFYNFFEIIFLKELSLEDVEKLIKNRAGLDNGKILDNFESYKPRIKAVGTLTGGNPRLILLLYQIITESELVEVEDTLLKILDELTPYLQSKMESLPPQQRKILDTLISLDSPATPTEIANAARMDVNVVNSQIKRLETNGFIEPIKLKKKKLTRYEVKERLFRIWREMRSPIGEKRIRFLVRFLKIWYTPDELLKKYKEIAKHTDDFFELGKLDEAKGLVKHLCYIQEAFPLKLRHEIHPQTVYKMIKIGEFTEAKKEIEKLSGQAEKEKDANGMYIVFLEKALLYKMQNEFEKALETLNNAIDLNPLVHGAFCEKGRILVELGRYNEALETFDRAIELDSACPTSLSDKGHTLYLLGHYEEALRNFNRALKLDKTLPQALFGRGRVLDILSKYEKALKSIDKGLKITPKDGYAWSLRGTVNRKMGRLEEALKSFSKASELTPDYAVAWFNQGSVLRELGRNEEALESYNKGLKVRPIKAEEWFNRGLAFYELKKYEESLKCYTEGLKLKPKDGYAWCHRGKVLMRLKKHKEALKNFDKALIMDSKFECYRVWIERAVILRSLNKLKESFQSVENSLKLAKEKKDQDLLKDSLNLHVELSLELSKNHALKENYGESIKWLNKALQMSVNLKEEKIEESILPYLKELAKGKKYEFAERASNVIVKNLGEQYAEFLMPFSKALEYIKAQDVDLLEKLQKEVRQTVISILREIKAEVSIPKVLE